jgi:hypothetical protein
VAAYNAGSLDAERFFQALMTSHQTSEKGNYQKLPSSESVSML